VLLLLVAGTVTAKIGMVMVKEGGEREKREVGATPRRKYARLEHSIMVQSDIRSRYASTLISSQVENTEEEPREIFFSVFLPESAFISRFAMEIEGIFYVAEVKEKEDAWRKYKEAVKEGKTAGHVEVTARHSNRFRVSVSTGQHSIVTFYLLYEELLERKGGQYQYVVNISPHQRIANFRLGLSLTEQRNITRLQIPGLKRQIGQVEVDNDSMLRDAHIVMSPSHPGQATVNYKPDPGWLERELRQGRQPLQFVLQYEVDRVQEGGEVQLMEGFFVHYIAPENLQPMPKHVVFVLDTSGSMKNRKMQQTIEAMVKILGEMRPQDYITILDFSTNVTVWERREGDQIIPATTDNIQTAVTYVENLVAQGETNINGALIEALEIIEDVQENNAMEGVQSMMLFLTDGHPTVGETDTVKILQNVRKANEKTRCAIFSLAFGRKTDFGMLRRLSIQNFGFARKIYTAADASLQLEGFYKEVSSPILSDVSFNYLSSDIVEESLTETAFHTFYQGGEMVVAGILDMSSGAQPQMEYEVTAHQATGSYKVLGSGGETLPALVSETVDTYIDLLPPDGATQHLAGKTNFMERLWAYLTIKNLLIKVERGELMSCNPQDRKRREGESEQSEDRWRNVPVICNNLQRALYLSLRYQFVTPLTSLVVIKPDTIENGDIAQADLFNKKIQLYNSSVSLSISQAFLTSLFICLALSSSSRNVIL